ncbi:NAD binding domain of 6-phosphogluconate dehydrogenase-domain-containing protein [Podospora fimiseda]|uniref:3-hydroxyisobutyrate dehydrogenase n=1 Tax=Podospora fimiseda TaxID=252190 RepID=A0AAN7BVP0_9PEZI|nr:NAD binding domain of 6-phosphogluconate dehydrogenase-domain-containing protein [Podospora fimiseda]
MSHTFVTVSALDAGHLTLPERLFVTDAVPDKRSTVPSLSFLIQHPSHGNIIFDLGIKRNIKDYTPAQQAHIAQRQPTITSPDCADSLRNNTNPLDPTKDINYIILSHVHWDHVGTPSDFPNSTFLVGSGTLDVLLNGAGPLYPSELFNHDELPFERTIEFPPIDENGPKKHTFTTSWTWKPLPTFPFTLDLFNDGSIHIIDAPGHLYGHINLLCRLSESKYVYLGGDCCHDPRILTGEKGIALYDDGKGGMRSVHVNTGIAEETLQKVREFTKESDAEVEVIVAHDGVWREKNRDRFWPGQLSKQTTSVPIMSRSPADIIAFIGLGVMGYPMAKNLRAGLGPDKTLLICDVNTEALERFIAETPKDQGPVEIVTNGHEAAKAANVIITMLPTSSSVKTVYLDPKTGIISSIITPSSSPKKLLLECGTIESDTIISLSKSLSPFPNLTFVDAPVSGGPMGAQNATLTFMVGCSPSSSSQVFPQVKSLLSYMGNRDGIFLCGDVGAGIAFKIINNYLSAITSLAASEALNIGVKAGLDPKLLTEVINASGGQCWVTSKSNPVPGVQEGVPSSRGYEGGFRVELCAKVLGMGTKLAKDVGARTVLDKPTLEAFGEVIADERYKGKDARVVYKWLNDQ